MNKSPASAITNYNNITSNSLQAKKASEKKSIPAALSRRTEAGGVFKMKVKLLSCKRNKKKKKHVKDKILIMGKKPKETKNANNIHHRQ